MNQPTPTKPAEKTTSADTQNVWYKNYILLVFVIGLPALVVFVCIFFIIYAIKVQDSTVRDDWYMDGKALYADALKDQTAHILGASAVMQFSGQAVTVTLSFTKSNPNHPTTTPDALHALISHATDVKQDQELTLIRKGDLYHGHLPYLPKPAKYYIQLSDPSNTWRLMHAYKLPTDKAILTPLPAFAEQKSGQQDRDSEATKLTADDTTH